MDTIEATCLDKQPQQVEAFRASECCYQQLAELCVDAVFIECEGKVVVLNQAAVRLCGAANSGELIGRSILDFVPPEYRDVVKQRLHQLSEHEATTLIEQWLQLNGTILAARVTALRCFYMGKPAAQIVMQSRSDRKLEIKGEQRTAELVITNEQLRSEIAACQRVEAALRQSEQLLSDFFEHANVGMHWISLDGYILRVNQAQLNLLGYTRSDYLGHHIAEFFADPAAVDAFFQQLLNHKSLCHYEAQLRCKDGSIKHVAIDSNVLWQNNRFIHTRCVVHDLTKRKQVEAALHKKERQLKALLNNIPDIAWLKDRDSRFVAVNEPFSKACGVSSEDLVGKNDYAAWSLDLAQKYRDDDANVIASGERQCFEEPLIDRTGQVSWIETIKTPIFNDSNEVVGTTGIARDVSQRRQLEAALRQSEQRLSLALSATRTGIWEWDIPTNQTFWSDTVFQLIGREPGSYESNYENWLQTVHPDDRSRADLSAKQAIVNRSSLNLEYRIVLPDNTVRWLTCIGQFIHSEQGQPLKMTGITTDITDRMTIEAERQQTETALRDLTHQLQQQNARLAEVSRLKSEFLANMSHELRTPLTSILGFSSILLQQHFGTLTAKQEQYLARIHTSGEHLLMLINDLLDLVKIEAGRLELHVEPISLVAICEAALQIIEARTLEKHQQLLLELPVACELVTADRQRLLQILLNYLSNAVKFTPTGGKITLSTRVAYLNEAATADVAHAPQYVVLSVHDTGIGIPVEKQHLLFQMFQQVDGALTRSHDGTGLGLALTKRLVELHKGKVSFTSTPGVGSTFSAWLPLEPHQTKAAK